MDPQFYHTVSSSVIVGVRREKKFSESSMVLGFTP